MYQRGGPANGNVQTGTVKSWNGSNGYGFIECPGAGGDVMFLRTSLPPDCKEVRGKFLDGKQVQFEVQTGNNGKSQAANIQIHVTEGDFLAGRIKSFSERNNYGFIESSMMPGQDIRFSVTDFQDMMPGVNLRDQLVVFQVMSTPDGKQRVGKIMFQSSKIAQNVRAGAMVAGGMGGIGGQGAAGVCPYFAKGQCQKGTQCKWSHGNDMGGAGAMAATACPYFLKGTCQKGDECKWSHTGGGANLGANNNFNMGNQMGGMKRGAEAMAATACPYFSKGTCQKGNECKWSHTGGGANLGANNNFGGASFGNNNGFKKQKTGATGTPTGQHSSGIIKSYNTAKGFGFITADGIPNDVFFMKSELPAEAQNEDCSGCGVYFEVMNMPDGKLRASNITSV